MRKDFIGALGYLVLSILLLVLVVNSFSGIGLRTNRAKSYCLQETGETSKYILRTGRRAYDVFCYEDGEYIFAYSEYEGERVVLEE